MKTKKKPLGIKHRIGEERKREERIGLAVIVAILIVVIFVSGFLINSMLNRPSTDQPVGFTSELKAAIVDQLSLTYPNQTFIETATSTLKQAGYTVDYYLGEKVTVELYKSLPSHGYKVIILRTHSATIRAFSGVALFTSEPYNTQRYVYEQLTDQIGRVVIHPFQEGDPSYFSIRAKFVRQSLHGSFHSTTIIMMGCYGLMYTDLAEAFVEKGAKTYIGWSGDVSASCTDHTAARLLQHLITQKQTIKQAIEDTTKEVGPDAVYGSQLNFYPPYIDVEEYTIP